MPAALSKNSATLDPLDRQIVRCLQLSPRAAYSTIASALDVSEQTVARRYRRMHRQGVVRVVAQVNPRALGESDWIVRLRCRPEATLDMGRALAQREDVAWVSLSGAGSEIVCSLRARTRADRESLLLDRLPRSAAVQDVSASVVLKRFVGGAATDSVGTGDLLTPEQEQVLGAAAPVLDPPRSEARLDDADRAVLAVLARDGRTGYRELATAAKTTEGRVTRRLSALLESGVVYLDVDVAAEFLGFTVSAYVWLSVVPGALEQACLALAEYEGTPFVAAISGRANAVVTVVCRGLDDLYDFVTTRIGAIDGVQNMEIAPSLRTIKHAGTLSDGARLSVG